MHHVKCPGSLNIIKKVAEGTNPEASDSKRAKAAHIPTASGGSAAAQAVPEVQRSLEQNKTIMQIVKERELFSPLRDMSRPKAWSSQWNGAKSLYGFVQGVLLERDPEHMVVLHAVVDSQAAFRKEFGILNQTIWSLARCDIVKRFEKLIEFSLWGPCTVIADFESICVGRVCQESEDLSVPLSMSCLCVDVLYLIFDFHVVVCSLFHVLTMSKVAVKLLVEKCFVPISAVALCSGRQSPRFDLTGDCPGLRLSIQARTAQSHMERSATPSCGHAALGLAKNSAA